MTNHRIAFCVFDETGVFFNRFILVYNDECAPSNDNIDIYDVKFFKKFDHTLRVDCYFLSVFHNAISSSQSFRRLVFEKITDICSALTYRDIYVKLLLILPEKEIIDYGWNKRLEHLLVERRELDHAMSWLSTLGGAFSALGDSFGHCAKLAGKISVQQFSIALKLGDPPLAARCRLYMALSLIQQGNLKIAKKIIEAQYKVAKDYKDNRLQNMCKGVWAKLQYYHQLRKSIKY